MTPPPGSEVAKAESASAATVDLVKPGPDGLVHAEYSRIARAAERYEGIRAVSDHYLCGSALSAKGTFTPGYGSLKVTGQAGMTLSTPMGQAGPRVEGGRLGIVVDKVLAQNVEHYLARKKHRSPTWKMVPPYRIARSEIATTAPWLAVIVTLKLVEGNYDRLAAGHRDNVFRYVIFDGGSVRGEVVAPSAYDIPDGNKEMVRLQREWAKAKSRKN